MRQTPITILMADDDEDDLEMTREALFESRVRNRLVTVTNGEECLNYLYRTGKYAAKDAAPRPGLILLDLNMPRVDGREVLKKIKQDPNLRSIPVVVLTTSKAEEDVFRTYDLGVNSYIVKPVDFAQLVEIMKTIDQYWFTIVEIPA